MLFISSQNMRRCRSKVINYNGYTLTQYHIAHITYDEFNNKYTKVDILFRAQETFWNNLLQGRSKSKDWRTNQFKKRTRRAH